MTVSTGVARAVPAAAVRDAAATKPIAAMCGIFRNLRNMTASIRKKTPLSELYQR